MRSDWTYLAKHGDAPERDGDEHQVGAADRDGGGTLGYYTGAAERGEPPGTWWGAGAEQLGLHGTVSAAVMEPLYGRFEHPATGEQLGRAPRRYKTYDERLALLLAREPLPTPERRA